MLTRLPTGDRLTLRRADGPARLPALPPGANLLGDAHGEAEAVPFGVEERCRAEAREGGIDLICTPGTSAAGLLLRFGARYPHGAALAGAVQAAGDPGFRAQFGRSGDDAGEALGVAPGTLFPLPGGAGNAPAQLVILAPAAGGTLRIARAALVPATRPQSPAQGAGAWAWEPALWQTRGPALLDAARDRGLARLSVTLAITDDGRVEDPDALAAFVRAARIRGIAVEAVEGDPDMVFAGGLAAAVRRARAIADYQRVAAPEARLAGVQYDIEPYALPAWGREPAGYGGWSDAVLALARALEAPIHLVLPFWIAEEEEGRAFLRAVEAAVSGVTAMAYRTDAARIAVAAEPLLAWGSARGKPVRVALETGPVAEETEQLFHPAPRGRLAVAPAGTGRATATLLPDETALPGAAMYAPGPRTVAPPARISFLGDDRKMRAAAHALAAPLAAWSAFDGFFYHGLSWPEGAVGAAGAEQLNLRGRAAEPLRTSTK